MRDVRKTKSEFERALFALLGKKNYHDITVNEICALANKTKMTFYHYYKDKAALLAEASVNLINGEYARDCAKTLANETDLEEIEYQSLVITYDLVARHYNQIRNLVYRGETLPLEIFKSALFSNYKRYLSELIAAGGYDIPSDYMSIFCFEGLYSTCIYYAEQLRSNRDKKQIKEALRKACRILSKAVMFLVEEN